MAAEGFDQAVERAHRAVVELLKGNPEPQKQRFSQQEDVSLANPMGLIAHGPEQVNQMLDRVAAQMSGGDINFENLVTYVTPEIGFMLDLEHSKAKVGSVEDISPFTLRVTTIFRREGDAWKIVHRHADGVSTPQPIESLVQSVAD